METSAVLHGPLSWQAAPEESPLASGCTAAACAELRGRSQAMRHLHSDLAKVAATELTVLLLGETGTGKGLAARAVHELSARAARPFVPVNCGALPAGLVESELFGHERGAFTGAVGRKPGKVEAAAAGTLVLDEIGDLPLAAQAKLLHLLEERTFERVGGTQRLACRARIVAATHRDLASMVAEGSFRHDLYYRLCVFPLALPPLRARREDIPELAAHFAGQLAAALHKRIVGFDDDAVAALVAADWPGNVRQLQHVVRRAVVVCRGPVIRRRDLELQSPSPAPEAGPEALTPAEYERRYLTAALERSSWVIKGPGGVAQRLGMPPSTVRDRMRSLGILRP